MARRLVLGSGSRCPGCRMPPRWCICEAFQPLECALRIDVLMDHVEQWRPSSTGHLINRMIPAAGRHPFRRGVPLDRDAIHVPGRELWILHPRGDPMPRGAAPENVQVLLLDGAWRETAIMFRKVESWGRKVCLPMAGTSRYWLRTQVDAARFSTIEALLFLLGSFGLLREQAQLRLQFELHVYAGLLVRGKLPEAADYLLDSPVRDALPDLVRKLRSSRLDGVSANADRRADV